MPDKSQIYYDFITFIPYTLIVSRIPKNWLLFVSNDIIYSISGFFVLISKYPVTTTLSGY